MCSGSCNLAAEAHCAKQDRIPLVKTMLQGRLAAAAAGTRWSCRPRAGRRRRSWAPTGMLSTRWASASHHEHLAVYITCANSIYCRERLALLERFRSCGWCQVQGDGTVCTLRQLLPGCTYRVRVAAHNAAGQGAFSFPADILTAATSPNPPTDLQVASRCVLWGHFLVTVIVKTTC